MTPPDDDSDRDAILARRAIFLSTALAALHCGSPRDATKPTATDVTVVGTTSPSGVATTSTTSRRSDAPPLVGWGEVVRLAPPRGVPKAAAGNEKTQLEGLEQALDRKYGALKEAWDAVPDCDAADPGCRASWRTAADKLRTILEATRRPMIGGCGGVPGLTGSIVGRQQAHDRYLGTMVEKLEARLTAVAESFSPSGEQEWRKLLANAKEPPPMPCLSPCMRPEVQEITMAVLFDKNASTLREDPATKTMLDGVVATFKGNTKPAKLEVRGHADAGETKPDELAKARAAAIAKWIEKAGIPRAQIRERAIGADFPVERGDADDTASRNRRVDFEVIP